MPRKCSNIAVVAITLLLSTANFASAQVNTFTSGGPPLGDGNDYPRSLNRSSQTSGGGASVDIFYSDLVGYTNANFNPAFFDSNNLLTRPAALINGDAFWTDPKLGNFTGPFGDPFQLAQIGFEFNDASFESFGFDLAVASASGTVPTSLPFQIQDFDADTFGFGSFVLDPDAGGNFGEVYPVESGRFATLGGRLGREARYRIDKFEIEDLLGEPLSGGSWFLDFDLQDIATLGGTSQVAIDNFVLDGAPIPPGSRDPNFIFTEFPFGENRPQYLNYDDEPAPDNPNGDTYNYDPSEFTETYTQARLDIEDPPSDSGANSFTDDVSILFPSDAPQNGLVRHEVTHTRESTLNPNELPENSVVLGGDTSINSIFDDLPFPDDGDEPAQIFQLTTKVDRAAESASAAIKAAQNSTFDAIGDLGSQPSSIFSLDGLGGSIDKAAMHAHKAINSIPDTEEIMEFDLLQVHGAVPLAMMIGEAPEPMLYTNTTVGTYLAIKEAAGEELVIGDEGFFITPIFDDNSDLVSYSVTTWLVTNEDGIYTAYITGVPEPSSVVLVLACVAAMAVRHRWK